MKTLYLLIFILFSLASCTKINHIKQVKGNEIDLGNAYFKNTKLKLSEIADSVYYIPLETDSNSVFGRIKNQIENIQITNSRIFVNDGNQLLSFDYKGKFINKISRKGRGPSEYIKIDDFALIENERQIVIKCDAQQKLIFYNYENKYIKSLKINSWPSHLSILNNKYIVLANEKGRRNLIEYYTFSVVDFSGKFENYLLKQNWEEEIEKKDKVGLSNMANFSFLNDTLTYWEFQYNTIWQIIDKNKIIPKYHINLGPLKMPDRFLLMSSANESDRRNEFVRLWQCIETKRYLFFDVGYKEQLKHIIYDKITKEAFNITNDDSKQKISIANDVDKGISFWPEGLFCNNKVYSLTYGFELLNKMKKEGYLDNPNKFNSKLEDLVANTNIMANPILMVVKIKN